MRREFYPLLLRTEEKRGSIARIIARANWKEKVSILAITVAIAINFCLIVSILAGEGESTIYEINSWVIQRKETMWGNYKLPVYGYTYKFLGKFHVGFWVMTGITLGITIYGKTRPYEEVKRMRETFVRMNIGIMLIGIMKIVPLIIAMEFSNLINTIELTGYLMCYLMIIGIPLIIIERKKRRKWERGEELVKKRRRNWRREIRGVGMIIVYTIGIALTYLGIEKMV